MPMPKGSLAADEHGAYHFDSDAMTPPPAPKADAIGEANAAAQKTEQGPVQDVMDMLSSGIKHIPAALGGMIDAAVGHHPGTAPREPDVAGNLQNVIHAVTNPTETLSSVGDTLRNATPEQVGANVVAPLLAGGGAGRLVGAVGDALGPSTAAAAETASPAGQLGLRSTTGRPVATFAAGSTAGPTLDAQNLKVASSVLGAESGVAHGVPVNPTSLAAGRVAPGQLLDTAAESLPAAPLSPDAAAKVKAARGPATLTKPTPNVATQIDGIESALLDDPNKPITGTEIRATRNSLSSDANAGMNSPDADTRTIAKYKRGIIDALDQHVADTMPADSAISPEMIQNARATLAKNYNVQDLIGKGGDINLQALAKMHRDNPNMLTGNMRTVAQFASDHPEVTGPISDADRISPPSLGTDVGHINVINPKSWVQPIIGAAGRSSLRGPAGASLEAAQRAPVAGLGGEFSPSTPEMAVDEEAPSSVGITATPITQKLGDIMPGQRGAVGAPTDIGGLRKLMTNPRTYTGMKPEDAAALEDALKKLENQPRTYSGPPPLGNAF